MSNLFFRFFSLRQLMEEWADKFDKKTTMDVNTCQIDSATLEKLLQNTEEVGQTIVHCRYVSSSKYVNGGWVNIFPDTFLIGSDGVKIQMTHAINIPIGPKRHYFSRHGEEKHFTLLFPALPENWTHFRVQEYVQQSIGLCSKEVNCSGTGVYHTLIF